VWWRGGAAGACCSAGRGEELERDATTAPDQRCFADLAAILPVMLLRSLAVDPVEFGRATGWSVKPEGACRGDLCVPLPAGVSKSDGALDAVALAERLGMPLVAADAGGLWALGPASAPTGRSLPTATAPELVLPDLRTGDAFALSSLRGQKVVLLAWASW
jgi:hypothetical protein